MKTIYSFFKNTLLMLAGVLMYTAFNGLLSFPALPSLQDIFLTPPPLQVKTEATPTLKDGLRFDELVKYFDDENVLYLASVHDVCAITKKGYTVTDARTNALVLCIE